MHQCNGWPVVGWHLNRKISAGNGGNGNFVRFFEWENALGISILNHIETSGIVFRGFRGLNCLLAV